MGLRVQAEADLALTLEDDVHGFGWPIKVTDPDGNHSGDQLVGQSNDIAQAIDPNTGQIVSGRLASVVLRISSLAAVTPTPLGIPVGVADGAVKPWTVEVDDVNGNSYTFKVAQSDPDRGLGIVTLLLENYA